MRALFWPSSAEQALHGVLSALDSANSSNLNSYSRIGSPGWLKDQFYSLPGAGSPLPAGPCPPAASLAALFV